MIYKRLLILLQVIHKVHGLHNPKTIKKHTLGTLIKETKEKINGLCETLGQENHQLRDEIGQLSHDYLNNADKNNIEKLSKKLEYLQLMFTNMINACLTTSNPHDLNYLSFRVIGIEKSMLYKELSSCSLLSFFYRSDEEQLYYDILKAVDKFNEDLRFKGELQDLEEESPRVINHEFRSECR